MKTLIYWMIIISISIPSWGFMQECPPADTIVVNPPQSPYSFPYLNNWGEVEVMTWNIKEFPLTSNSTDYINEIISETLPDIICIQEIEDNSAYNSLATDLPAYSFISTNYSGTNLDMGIAVRNDCGDISNSTTLFNSEYWAFAGRYPLKADISWHCGTAFLNLEVINVHFKAYDEGFDQRLAASELLSEYINSNLNVNIIVAGDFNDEIDDPQNSNSLWPLISNDYAYFVTTPIAGNSYYNSYPWGSYTGFIDHILISSSLYDENENGSIATIRLDDYMGASTYQNEVSDHRPVLWSIPVEVVELNTGLVINEIMQHPAVVSGSVGEWIEITNISDTEINLNGLILRDDGGDEHIISDNNLVITPGGLIIIGANDNPSVNGGAPVDYQYSGFSLSNNWDEVILAHPSGVTIDEVHYDNGVTFPDESGASMMLLDPHLDNSLGANWAAADVPFGLGDLGTPGEPNFPNTECTTNGDVNMDGGLNVLDVVLIANYILNMVEFTATQICIADINQDGGINILDVVQLVGTILNL